MSFTMSPEHMARTLSVAKQRERARCVELLEALRDRYVAVEMVNEAAAVLVAIEELSMAAPALVSTERTYIPVPVPAISDQQRAKLQLQDVDAEVPAGPASDSLPPHVEHDDWAQAMTMARRRM